MEYSDKWVKTISTTKNKTTKENESKTKHPQVNNGTVNLDAALELPPTAVSTSNRPECLV